MTPLQRMERGEWVGWAMHLIIQAEEDRVADQRDTEFKQALDKVIEKED